MFTVYALYSRTFDKVYVGFTSNLEQRMLSHTELGKKGWTIKYRPWELFHSEIFESKHDAMKRGKELKSGKGREYLRGLLKDF